MPVANVYLTSDTQQERILASVVQLQEVVSKELSCDDRQLDASEVSIRIMIVPRVGRIADVEVDICAAPYAERVERQDIICRTVAQFLQDQLDTSVYVWLLLTELGHSAL